MRSLIQQFNRSRPNNICLSKSDEEIFKMVSLASGKNINNQVSISHGIRAVAQQIRDNAKERNMATDQYVTLVYYT